MARTTQEAVISILDPGSATPPDLAPFIETASALITKICVPEGYDDIYLELIERWLSAHFYHCSVDMKLNSEGLSGASHSYQSKTDLGLALTHYGQKAMVLDVEGGLAQLNQDVIKGQRKERATAYWLGSSNQSPPSPYFPQG